MELNQSRSEHPAKLGGWVRTKAVLAYIGGYSVELLLLTVAVGIALRFPLVLRFFLPEAIFLLVLFIDARLRRGCFPSISADVFLLAVTIYSGILLFLCGDSMPGNLGWALGLDWEFHIPIRLVLCLFMYFKYVSLTSSEFPTSCTHCGAGLSLLNRHPAAFDSCVKCFTKRIQSRVRLNLRCPKCGSRFRNATVDMIGDVGVCNSCHEEFEIVGPELNSEESAGAAAIVNDSD